MTGDPRTGRGRQRLTATETDFDVIRQRALLVGTGFGYAAERRARQAEVLAEVLPRVRDIRRLGAAAIDLCLVAEGALDLYYERGINAWDVAAGGLVAAEAGAALFAFAPENVAETGLAFALRPAVHAVAEGARAATRRRDGPNTRLWVLLDHAGEDLESRAAEMPGDVGHLDRVAQIGLVGAVLLNGRIVGDARELRGHRFAVGELLKHAAHDRLHGGEDVLLLDETHFQIELIELAR